MNSYGNCLIYYQLIQFEWIVIVVDSSIRIQQFNMWNDFDWLLVFVYSHLPFFTCENELSPILIVFNRFNPSILNVCTDPKQLLPIFISSSELRLYRQYSLLFPNVSLPNVMECRFGRSNHYNIQYQFNTSNHK